MKWIFFLIVGLLFFCGYFGVRTVYLSHQQAELIAQLQSLKQQKDKINANWTQLLLEQKLLVNDKMIDRAVEQGMMNLHVPSASQVVYLD